MALPLLAPLAALAANIFSRLSVMSALFALHAANKARTTHGDVFAGLVESSFVSNRPFAKKEGPLIGYSPLRYTLSPDIIAPLVIAAVTPTGVQIPRLTSPRSVDVDVRALASQTILQPGVDYTFVDVAAEEVVDKTTSGNGSNNNKPPLNKGRLVKTLAAIGSVATTIWFMWDQYLEPVVARSPAGGLIPNDVDIARWVSNNSYLITSPFCPHVHPAWDLAHKTGNWSGARFIPRKGATATYQYDVKGGGGHVINAFFRTVNGSFRALSCMHLDIDDPFDGTMPCDGKRAFKMGRSGNAKGPHFHFVLREVTATPKGRPIPHGLPFGAAAMFAKQELQLFDASGTMRTSWYEDVPLTEHEKTVIDRYRDGTTTQSLTLEEYARALQDYSSETGSNDPLYKAMGGSRGGEGVLPDLIKKTVNWGTIRPIAYMPPAVQSPAVSSGLATTALLANSAGTALDALATLVTTAIAQLSDPYAWTASDMPSIDPKRALFAQINSGEVLALMTYIAENYDLNDLCSRVEV